MLSTMRWSLSLFSLLMVSSILVAQQPPPPAPVEKQITKIPPPQQVPPPPDRSVIAATVNSKKIPEIAVYRAMVRVPPKMWDKARPEILNFLIENALIDDYLERIKIPVDEKDVDKKMAQIREELKKEKQSLNDLLVKLYLNEAELREQIMGALRWEKFVEKYAPEAELKKLFIKDKNMFNGSLVRARHLLIKAKDKTQKAQMDAQAKAKALKQQIEAQAAQELNKVSATDKITQEKARRDALEKAFGDLAAKESDCPSKKQGGELGWFPRLGKMVEPFARAAFGSELYQITDPVKTEFGYHLIMVTDRKPGRDVKYEQVRLFVREVYAEKLREAILRQMRPSAKIQLMPNKTQR